MKNPVHTEAGPRPPIILASSSAYRAALLARLGLPFQTRKPEVSEAIVANEAAAARASRLAKEKTFDVARAYQTALIIGSDQVAACGDDILEKPATATRAAAQLAGASGRRVDFHTAVCVHNIESGWTGNELVTYSVYFRELSNAEIAAYLKLEQPFDCAGSIKSEGLGITLFERMEGDDPTALIGLPLIALTRMLRAAGINVPA